MTSTQKCPAPSGTSAAKLSLNKVIFDELMRVRRVRSIVGLARLAGVNRSTIFRLRAGETRASQLTAEAIAVQLDTNVSTRFPEPVNG